jgi:hypothetical protein
LVMKTCRCKPPTGLGRRLPTPCASAAGSPFWCRGRCCRRYTEGAPTATKIPDAFRESGGVSDPETAAAIWLGCRWAR